MSFFHDFIQGRDLGDETDTHPVDEAALWAAAGALTSGRCGDAVTATSTQPQHDGNGFVKTLHINSLGRAAAHWIWMCGECDQVREKGHAPYCKWAK